MRVTQLRQADLNLLVVFSVLAEERNVSRAAKRLLLSQPAVSRAPQRMRATFHDDLLVRTDKGYEPTPQGERVLRELEVMLPRLDRLISGSSFDPAAEPGSFRIAATDNATSILAPILCRNVLPAAKQVRFTSAAWRSGAFDDLSHGRLDLALIGDEGYVPSPLQTEVTTKRTCLCCFGGVALSPPTHPGAVSCRRAYHRGYCGRLSADTGEAIGSARPSPPQRDYVAVPWSGDAMYRRDQADLHCAQAIRHGRVRQSRNQDSEGTP
jgi:DNA-binding transcriptional LysR family regulator